MTLDECLRIARELRLDESNRHPELHYLATPQDLLAFARQVEAEALEKAMSICEENGNLYSRNLIRALKEESNGN